MGETAIIAAVVAVAAVASAGSAIYAGEQQAAAGEAMREQYEQEREAAKIAADQEEAERRRRLNSVLSAQNALRAGRGLDLNSPTGIALRERSIDNAEADIATLSLTAGRTDRRLNLSGQLAEDRGSAAQVAGYASAASSIAQGASGAYRASSPLSNSGR